MLVGDFGQLPPVMDLPSTLLYLGQPLRTTSQVFAKAELLPEVLRQDGQEREQYQALPQLSRESLRTRLYRTARYFELMLD